MSYGPESSGISVYHVHNLIFRYTKTIHLSFTTNLVNHIIKEKLKDLRMKFIYVVLLVFNDSFPNFKNSTKKKMD